MDSEGRQEAEDAQFKTVKKREITAFKRTMDGFESHLATVRSQLEARRELASAHRFSPLPAVNSSAPAQRSTISKNSTVDHLKLPLLQQIERTREANAPPKDPFLKVENVLHRSFTRELYEREADSVAAKALAAASTTKSAQQLGEEARKRMVVYSQNESGWRFEERTSRYQQVMEIKQQADKKQQEADLERTSVRQMKSLLRDPYAELRSATSVPMSATTLLQKKEYEWLWVLASASTKLAFTPREETPDSIMDSEKELSMYVVYYIAASGVNTKCIETEEECQTILNNDCPPTGGWICCSVQGVPPAPELATVRSGIQAWTVVGAGVAHLNGKYVACGMHDNVKRFKSPAGVELFRKCVPIASALSQALHSGDSSRPVSATSSITDQELRGKEDDPQLTTKTKPGVVLPSGLVSIENDELDFRSMERVGSWLSMNESIQRNRRMLASRSTISDPEQGTEAVKLDGNSVMNQESREIKGTSDVTESRPEVSSSLCREWVLFTRCSRRRSETTMSGASEPPVKGIGLGCLKRHYFISLEEKAEMTTWVQTKESWLEKNVLTVIIEREAQMERVHHLSRKCMTKYQQNLKAETEMSKVKLLAELNRVRFLTVKILETIDLWRQHTRKIGFARYDSTTEMSNTGGNITSHTETEAPLLWWSSSITLETGKQLYKGSKAFVSKVKRFRRSEDVDGKREQHIVYLGYFETQEEAERAYDEHAASEARRLNTTVEHLPRRRNVFRSCGKHFAVESEKDGPSFCIECKTKQLASLSATSADEWIPPFFYGTGVNYIMKMANDLDFLDDVLPLKAALNNGRGSEDEAFPMRGNVFLLPKTPIQDPNLAVFTTFSTPTAPRLGESTDSPSINDIDEEALDRERIFKAQHIFLQELQIYQPDLIAESLSRQNVPSKYLRTSRTMPSAPQYRVVEALYWDHCAALKILQERPQLALRQPNIWCRPDAGEWASLVVRGANQLHFLFEEKLEKAGKELVQRRQQVLSALRQLNKVPLYFVPSRVKFTELIAAGQSVRGDVVQLEVNNSVKQLQRYDSWCAMSLVLQRWFRGVLGRRKAKATGRALRFACKLRVFYANQVATVANRFFCVDVRPVAVRKAYKTICTPAYSRVVMMDGELVTITFHSLRHYQFDDLSSQILPAAKRTLLPSFCCANCARRFHVRTHFQCRNNKFHVHPGVCTCSLNGGRTQESESWLIRAYSSSHNVIYRLRLNTPQLQQLISAQTFSKIYQRSSVSDTNSALIMNMETKNLAAIVSSTRATFCLELAERAAMNLANWRRMNTEATQTRKSLLVALEKQLSLLDRTKHAHVVAVGNATKALDFASRPFSEAQAWDPLENANDWRFIVEKRQLEKKLEEVQQEVERLRVAHFQATYNDQFTRANAVHAQDEYNNKWLRMVERESQAMEEAILVETTAKIRMESFMEQLCSRFLTLRDSFHAPTRRNLVIQSPVWHDMIPFKLDVPGLRRRLNHLRRRTLVLSNLAEQNRKSRRMIVTVSMWPLTRDSQAKRDFWVTAYDPIDCSVHNIFLEWELVQLLTGSNGRRIWQDPAESKRSTWRSIADILLSLTMLDRFTGVFTLQKLQFYHTMRRLSPQFLSSRVMRDLQAGRKCGQGDEILRQAVAVDGRLCTVVVYENWGDLTFAIYHSASGDFFRLVMPLSQVFDLLSAKPLMLRLWICCVKSNSYTPILLTYLLKCVKFYKRDDEHEDLRIERELFAQKRSKRFQTLLRIQNRKVLLSIYEDSSGDFFVSGYDMKSEFKYKLLLERESLHRALKSSALTHGPAAKVQSSFSLLLRRNRKLLFEWICSRLRFQSMLEHPEMVTSGTSPLQFGLHLRESFRILNRWIEASPRNPLHAVSEVEIARWASTIDAAAFSSLQFDQLTLIDHSQLPFGLEKKYVGTLNWVEALVGQSSEQMWRKELPYMRMDFFVKVHTLFARVRGELKAEAKERRKRENWAAMEQEDRNTLCLDIDSLLKSAKENVLFTWEKLSDLHAAATKRMDQWRKIHAALRFVAKSDEKLFIGGQTVLTSVNSARMLQEDSASMFLDLVCLWISTSTTDLVQLISLAISIDSLSPVLVAASLLHACLQRWECEMKATLANLEFTFEKIKRGENGLEELRKHKTRVLRFCNFLERQISIAPTDEENDDEVQEETGDVNQDETPTVIVHADMTINIGILIPCNNKAPLQEVFLADMPTWAPNSSFEAHARTLATHLRSFFQQQNRQQQISSSRFGRDTSKGVLTCQRVPYGLLVYRSIQHDPYTKSQLSQLNSRAEGLTGGVGILGPALFWPLQVGSNWYQHLLNCSAVYMELSSNVTELELEEGHLKHSTAVRSTKYLPWKQFAIKRLKVARAVKLSRVSEGVCIDLLMNDADEMEKEKQIITSVSIDFRQLEVSLGKRTSHEFLGNENATKCLSHLFVLQKEWQLPEANSVKWRVSIANPRIMHQVLDIYDADGRAIQIPRVVLERDNAFKMEDMQVEINDVSKPRRLIFSCRDIQTHRMYFVDCDYHCLQSLLRQRSQEKHNVKSEVLMSLQTEAKWRQRSSILTIREWRKLAVLATQFLVFRKKNGALSLCLELHTSEMLPSEKPVEISEEVEDPLCNSEKTDLPVDHLPRQHKCRADIREERKTVDRTLVLHFLKHQPAIRAAACGRMLAKTSDTGKRTASEWMQMTREDWRAQELRGMLVLDAIVLTRLETAYTPATQRAREHIMSFRKEDDLGGLELQLKDIVKGMGEAELQPNAVNILQSIRMTRWRRRGKEATSTAKRAEAHLEDVAEWWRRRPPAIPKVSMVQ